MSEIVLTNITKRWGDFIGVDNLSMTIEDRSFITLLGPSGCGKTTTLRMIAGLETPTSGRITIDGVPVFDSNKGINVPPQKRDVGFLFQNYALWPHMTVYKNIAFGLENLHWKKPDIDARVDELCKMLKIEQFKQRYPSELSGGQQQRVAIARTLAPKPKVLFMDEPLSNLDAKLRLEMRTELKRLHVDTDSTFVYVTHDQLEAMTLATKVCLMETGVMQQYDPPLVTYSSPNNLFVADFVGNPTMNFIDATASISTPGTMEIDMNGLKATMKCPEDLTLEHPEVVIGVRPEFINITKTGISGNVHATLPSGMETTVKIKYGDLMLTSVVFGGVDYAVDQPIKFSFVGSNILVFDKTSTNRICAGELTIVK
jgi:multiple sugar transport system ATP-binding protein